MTLQEWEALVELLNRIPMSLAERHFVIDLVNREMAPLRADAEAAPVKKNGENKHAEVPTSGRV